MPCVKALIVALKLTHMDRITRTSGKHHKQRREHWAQMTLDTQYIHTNTSKAAAEATTNLAKRRRPKIIRHAADKE